MQARFFKTLFWGMAALLFAGCAAITVPKLTSDNPANPKAPEAPVTPVAQVMQLYTPASGMAPGDQSQTDGHKSKGMKNMPGGGMSMPQGGGQ